MLGGPQATEWGSMRPSSRCCPLPPDGGVRRGTWGWQEPSGRTETLLRSLWKELGECVCFPERRQGW